jgi:hypothetical protein
VGGGRRGGQVVPRIAVTCPGSQGTSCPCPPFMARVKVPGSSFMLCLGPGPSLLLHLTRANAEKPYAGDTGIVLYPGHKSEDVCIVNFAMAEQLPESATEQMSADERAKERVERQKVLVAIPRGTLLQKYHTFAAELSVELKESLEDLLVAANALPGKNRQRPRCESSRREGAPWRRPTGQSRSCTWRPRKGETPTRGSSIRSLLSLA